MWKNKLCVSSITNYLKLIRAEKFTGKLLLLWPVIFSVLLVTKEHYNFVLLIKFIVGGFLMSGAGCVINDIVDQKFDKKVKRTKDRPLASGAVSRREAIYILAILLFFAFLILITLSYKTIIFGFFALIPVALYPYMKRITYYPQVFLGFTFNLGVLFVFLEVYGHINVTGLMVYIAMCLWTISYDTVYGFQDIEDDMKIGVKSIAILLLDRAPAVLEFINTVMIMLLFFVGMRLRAEAT